MLTFDEFCDILHTVVETNRNTTKRNDTMLDVQKYTSAATSINSHKLPVVFSLVKWENYRHGEKIVNCDFGCGKYTTHISEYLFNKGVVNLPIDKYNQSAENNAKSETIIKSIGGCDTCTCSNVLNVILEKPIRTTVIKEVHELLKDGGTAFFTVYEGNKSGKITINTKKETVQLNRKTSEYVDEITDVFGISNVFRRGKLIIAVKY